MTLSTLKNQCLLGSISALLILSASAQDSHFKSVEWKGPKESKHFRIFTSETNDSPARQYAEKVYDLVKISIPKITEDFEKNQFETPKGVKSTDSDSFKLSIYLTGEGEAFNEIVAQVKREGRKFRRNEIGFLADGNNRYLAISKSGRVKGYDKSKEARDVTSAFVHGTAVRLVCIRARKGNFPLWFTAGIGYYAEHKLLNKCQTRFMNFDSYYKENPGDDLSQSLDRKKPWIRPVKKLCKKGTVVSLQSISVSTPKDMTPTVSGYMFALGHFLMNDTAKYSKLVDACRDGKNFSKDLILESYGYADDASFEKDWYEYIKSSKFK